eukprot:TRINITY_DN2831_c0_g1_i1.p1 TRINITY_DN2831_c0_g1~~TRINITY_DN2831_c0_g1_i1.p1  ORF type:complete len:792 (-),score=101.82 TRINITY_DN2831_c0_g1_i1:394-2769(-)
MPKTGPKLSPPGSPGLEIVCSKSGDSTPAEKLHLVHEIAKWQGASDILHSWTRKDILQILFAATGKERKYTGLPKQKIIQLLLKMVSEKDQEEAKVIIPLQTVPAQTHDMLSRKQKKKDKEQQSRIPVTTLAFSTPEKGVSDESRRTCKNLACKAALSPDDKFCKRCSCCICYQFDDNKDPSLWLVCNSDAPYHGASCGLSYHVECVLRKEESQISKESWLINGDGSFRCISCGKINGLIECWKKQLSIAKDARRVGVLCYRVYLGHRLLSAAVRCKALHELVETAMSKLEEEVGPLKEVSPSMARGIVSRLSTGVEAQKLCETALEKAQTLFESSFQTRTDTMPLSQSNHDVSISATPAASNYLFSNPASVQIQHVYGNSVRLILSEDVFRSPPGIIGCRLWHRKVEDPRYSEQPTLDMSRSGAYTISDLQTQTEYVYRVVAFTEKGELDHIEFRCSERCDDKQHNFETKKAAEPRTSYKLCNVDLNVSAEEEAVQNCDASSPKVRDLGKIMQAAFATKRDRETCELESRDENSTPERKRFCSLLHTAESEDAHGDSISALDEERATVETGMGNSSHGTADSQKDSTNSSDTNQVLEVPKRERENNSKNDMEVVPFEFSNAVPPLNACKLETSRAGISKQVRKKSKTVSKDRSSRPKNMMSSAEAAPATASKKRSKSSDLLDCKTTLTNVGHVSAENVNGSPEPNYEYCVKVIRRLECAGYIQKDFRLKFLTWFSLRATSQEKKIVGVFVETMLDDPASLAGQLVDTFSEGICSKRATVLRNSFCSKLWH